MPLFRRPGPSKQELSATIGRGQPGGTAPLDETGKVPSGNLPPGLGGGGSTATALVPLDVPTYDNAPGVGHPDVLHIPGGFGPQGFTYWMFMTPLPGTARENPSIVASYDGVTWEVPDGLTNPIANAADAIADGYDYWADTDLVLSPDSTTLIGFFKGTRTGITNEYVRVTSTDGVTWSARQVAISHAEGAAVSPAVVVEDDGTLTMFEINGGVIQRRTSANLGVTWSAASVQTSRPTIIEPYNSNIWHIDVVKVGGIYHALVNAISTDPNTNPFRLFYWTSTNGLAWTSTSTDPAVPLTGGRYDVRGHYRSTLQPAASGEAGKFDVWTACIDDTRASNHTAAVWRVGVIRDFDFSDGDTWAFPEPPRSAFQPVSGDEFWIMADAIESHTGTATKANLHDLRAWAMSVDDYLTLTTHPFPKGWHAKFAVDMLVINPTTNSGDVQFQSSLRFISDVSPLAAGQLLTTVTHAMPATQYGLTWINLYDGSQSSLDVRLNSPLVVKVRRRGGPGNTYGTVDKPHVVAVRFRRV